MKPFNSGYPGRDNQENDKTGHDLYDLGHNWDMINWESTSWRSRKRSVLRAVLLNWLIDHPDKTIKDEFGIDLYELFDLELKLRSELNYYIYENSYAKIWMERNNATQREFEITALTFFTKDRWNSYMIYRHADEPNPIDELYNKLLKYTAQPNTVLEDYEYMIWYFIDKFYITENVPEEIFEFFPNTPREDIENLFQLIIKPEQPDTNDEDVYECSALRRARRAELERDIRNLTTKYQVDYESDASGTHKIDFTKRSDPNLRETQQNICGQNPITNTMKLREYGVIAKYMDSGKDLVRLAKTHKECRGLLEYFNYNPIPLLTTEDFNLFEPRSANIRPRPVLERVQRRMVRTVVEREFCRYVHYDEQEDYMLYHYSPLNNANRFRIFERLRALWQIYEQETEEEDTEED